jgi:gp6-like head-tail connector protein
VKISEITIEDLKDYANVVYSEDDQLFNNILVAARMFVKGFTGLSDNQLDLHEDLSMAVFILSNDLYDNRSYIVEGDNVNPVVSAILNLHAVNFL